MNKHPLTHSQTLLEFVNLLNSSLDFEEMLQHLLRSVLGYVVASKGLIAIQQDGNYNIVLARGLKGLKAGDLFDKDAVAELGIYRIYPIGDINNPKGYLGVGKPVKGEITSDHEELLTALLRVAASNITNAITHKQVQTLNQELKQKNQELRAVLEFSQELSLTIEIENILMLLALTLSGQWTIKRYSVITWKEPYLPVLRQKGIVLKDIDLLKTNLINLPKVIFVSDLPDSELKTTLIKQEANILFPISVANSKTEDESNKEILGVIILGQRPRKTYSKTDLELGSSLVAQAAVALQKAWYVREIVDKKQSAAKLIAQKQADKVFSALADVLPGSVLDNKYKLENKIGSGGFGAIYRAIHLELNKPVAVKILRPLTQGKNFDHLERFRQEAITACKLNHSNAVTIVDCCISKQGMAYIVMELLSGYSLADLLKKQGVLSLSQCAKILLPICNVLSHAHHMSMVHRDIKPENIFLHQTPNGEVLKVVDFGLAKIYSDDNEDTKDLTQYGEILGTPAYMSPERVRGDRCDGKADIYSLGIMLYEMLSARFPFTFPGTNFFSIAMTHINEKPIPLSKANPEIPLEIENIVMQTLHKNPSQRPTAKELYRDFLQAVMTNTTLDFSSKVTISDSKDQQNYTQLAKESITQQKSTQNIEKHTDPLYQINTIKVTLEDNPSMKTKIDTILPEILEKTKKHSKDS